MSSLDPVGEIGFSMPGFWEGGEAVKNIAEIF